MTVALATPVNHITVPVGWIGEPRLLRGVGQRDLVEHAQHLAEHGGLATVNRDQLLAALEAVGLSGRGGAAFPLARKIRSLRAGADPVVVVNGTEGEPSSAKDHVLLVRTPHLVLDGALVVAAAIGARSIVVGVTDPQVAAGVARALTSRPDRALFTLRQVEDRFITGEARALLSALSGGPAVPTGRRTLPTDRGLDGAPTVLSNAETFAQVAVLTRLGPQAYAATGTPAEPGTTLITVTGAVGRPGVLEVPFGVELGLVAETVQARASQAVVIGGYHGAWLRPRAELRLSKAGLTEAGGTFGAGAVMFVGTDTCPVAELARVSQWLADQSARQCGPCAFGLPALAADVRALAAGTAAPAVAERHAAMVTGRGACAHPDGAARFVRTGLLTVNDDVRTHQAYGTCRRQDRAHLPTTRRHAFEGR
jgi:NADH:ubiquinone oxidoreductase subunit F (NADH-binding)